MHQILRWLKGYLPLGICVKSKEVFVRKQEEQTKANDPEPRPKRKTIAPKYLADFV